MSDGRKPVGEVFLVGAGPGDPGLATVRALELLRVADCVVYDALANPALLDVAPAAAERIDVGKRPDVHKVDQDDINALLAEKALAGQRVVRLKGGDPFVFGRGSEEALYLGRRGIPVTVVPGVTAAPAAAACAGIPLTHRHVATTVTFVTGHEDPAKGDTQTDYDALAAQARSGGTLCFYMAMGRLQKIVDRLIEAGLPADTPAAAVHRGTLPQQRSVRGTLGQLVSVVRRAGLSAPAVVVVGQVVAVDADDVLRGFEKRPLFGQTVLITRTRSQASNLRAGLEALGAAVIEAPTIDIAEPASWQAVDDAIRGAGDAAWLVLTSANGVAVLRRRLEALELDARHLAGVKVAAIGRATADHLAAMGLRADLVPERFVAESLAEAMIAEGDVRGRRVVMLRADIARAALRDLLAEAGAKVEDVTAYANRRPDALPAEALAALRAGGVNWITFTSSSTVRNFLDLLGEDRSVLAGVRIASIGPITSATARELGLNVDLEASRHDVSGLIEALRAHHASH